jgi:hypothetical protein
MEWTQVGPGGTIPVDKQATGEITGKVPKLGDLETRKASDGADRAFPTSSKKTAKELAAARGVACSGDGRSRRSSAEVALLGDVKYSGLGETDRSIE